MSTVVQAVDIVDLGPLSDRGADYKELTINGAGLVAGVLQSTGGAPQPFTWQNGVMTDLPSLPGATAIQVTGVNATGQVAGFSNSSSSGANYVAVSWQNGSIQTLALPAGYSTSKAYGINDAGQIVGGIGSGSGSQSVLWQSSSSPATSLGAPAGTFAFGVNNTSQIAGGDATFLPQSGYLWQSGVVTGPPQSYITATGINGSGQIAGLQLIVGNPSVPPVHAVLWQGASVLDLGTLPGQSNSYATAINDLGQVVGVSNENGGGPFLWQNGTMINLNSLLPAGSPWLITAVWGISNDDQIVGTGILFGQQAEAILITVPEPSSVALAALGLIGLAAWGWRRRRGAGNSHL